MTIDPIVRTQIVLGAVNAATAKLAALTSQAAGDREALDRLPDLEALIARSAAEITAAIDPKSAVSRLIDAVHGSKVFTAVITDVVKEQLGAEILNVDQAVFVGAARGEIGFGENFERGGQNGRGTDGPALFGKLGKHGRGGVGLQANPKRGAGVKGIDIRRNGRGWAVFVEPRRDERGGVGTKVRGLGADGIGCRRPVANPFGAKGAGGRCLRGEPGGRADGGFIGFRPGGFYPGEVTQGGVKQFAVEAAVAASEPFFTGEHLLETRGQIAVGGDMRAQRVEKREIDAALAGGGGAADFVHLARLRSWRVRPLR